MLLPSPNVSSHSRTSSEADETTEINQLLDGTFAVDSEWSQCIYRIKRCPECSSDAANDSHLCRYDRHALLAFQPCVVKMNGNNNLSSPLPLPAEDMGAMSKDTKDLIAVNCCSISRG